MSKYILIIILLTFSSCISCKKCIDERYYYKHINACEKILITEQCLTEIEKENYLNR